MLALMQQIKSARESKDQSAYQEIVNRHKVRIALASSCGCSLSHTFCSVFQQAPKPTFESLALKREARQQAKLRAYKKSYL